jgi:hypothetical protein
MAKLISKCCVCGRIYKVVTINMQSVGKDEERTSHGYCSIACSEAEQVSLLVWDNELGLLNMDKGSVLGEHLYHRGVLQKHYLEHLAKESVPQEFKDYAKQLGLVIRLYTNKPM